MLACLQLAACSSMDSDRALLRTEVPDAGYRHGVLRIEFDKRPDIDNKRRLELPFGHRIFQANGQVAICAWYLAGGVGLCAIPGTCGDIGFCDHGAVIELLKHSRVEIDGRDAGSGGMLLGTSGYRAHCVLTALAWDSEQARNARVALRSSGPQRRYCTQFLSATAEFYGE